MSLARPLALTRLPCAINYMEPHNIHLQALNERKTNGTQWLGTNLATRKNQPSQPSHRGHATLKHMREISTHPSLPLAPHKKQEQLDLPGASNYWAGLAPNRFPHLLIYHSYEALTAGHRMTVGKRTSIPGRNILLSKRMHSPTLAIDLTSISLSPSLHHRQASTSLATNWPLHDRCRCSC